MGKLKAGSKEVAIENLGAVASNEAFDPAAGETVTVETVIAQESEQVANFRDGMSLIAAALTEDYSTRDGEIKNGLGFEQKMFLDGIVQKATYVVTNATKNEKRARISLSRAHEDLTADLCTKGQVKYAQRALERAVDRLALAETLLAEAMETYEALRGEAFVPYEKKETAE